MREQWARNIALFTGIAVVLLAITFARIQNPPQPPVSAVNEVVSKQPSTADMSNANEDKHALIAAGREVFEAQRCSRCHSIAGEGNPRYPLDGVGERRSAESIRQWILAPAELKDQLPAGAFQVKQTYHNQTPEDIDALVAYLQTI